MSYIYQKDIRRHSHSLTRLEQIELYDKIKKGDMNARDIVIQSCLPLVLNIAQKFRCNNKHIDLEDMVQEGNIALMRAVDSWDIEKGNITTVATWCIRNTLVDMINDSRYTIKYPYSLSRRAAEDLRKIKQVDSNDVAHISKITGFSVKRIKKLLSVAPRTMRRIKVGGENRKEVLNFPVEEVQESHRPCLGALINLINTVLRGDQKTIFSMWSGINQKRIGPKEIAKSLGKSEKYVYGNIYSAKRILSRTVKKVKNNA